jgi:hypothetical protein
MIYLYLARRDKKGIKILTAFKGDKIGRTSVSDIKKLGLPEDLAQSISSTVHENRMLWEVWLESADNFNKLREKLIKKGYSNLPIKANLIHQPKNFTKPTQTIVANLPLKPLKTMIKRGTKSSGRIV